jgi:hypothetical protein
MGYVGRDLVVESYCLAFSFKIGGIHTVIDQPLSDAFIHWYVNIVIFGQVPLVCGNVEVDRVVS